MYRSCNNLLSLQSMCKLFSISNILAQFTLSNAFSKSTKQIYTSFPHSKLLSHSVLITPTASLVPQPFVNPNRFRSNKCFAFASILFVNTFNIIFEACKLDLLFCNHCNLLRYSFFGKGIM